MNLKKAISLAILIGGITLCGKSPIVSHAIEYEQTLVKGWGDIYEDYASQIIQSSDGGFAIVGDDYKNGGFVLKLNKEFEEEWIRYIDVGTYGFLSSVMEQDGILVIGGMTNKKIMGTTLYGGSDGLILKMDLNGSLLSAQTVGGNKNDRINSVFPSSDGGILFVGESYSTNMGWVNQGCRDAFVGKYNSKGQQEWVRALANSSCGSFQSVVEMSDGGVVAVGSNEGATAVKYNSAGEQEWVQDFGQRFANFRDVIEGENGEIVIVGNRGLEGYTRDAIIVKCDALGNLQWEQVLGDESSSSTFYDVSISNDGHFIAAGQMGNDGVVVKFNHDGEYELLIQQVQNNDVEFNSVLMLPSGEIVVVGDSWATDFEFENKGDNDIILIKYSPKTDADIQINGTIETLIADVTIPSVSPDLVIDPNSPDGAMSPEFEIQNESTSPIKLNLKTFEQTTNTFNDVLPDKYDSWEGLNKMQSQDIALGLIAKDGDGWQRLTTPTSYVAGHTEHEIGVIKPTSQVNFEFEVHHGRAFSESKTVQYKLVFVFDLLS